MDASLRRGRSPTTSLFADGQSQRSTPPSVPPLLTNGLFESSSLHDGARTNLAHVGATPESPTSLKQTKRKRLAKACDSCHRSKRRCDGTARCANCEFAGKVCTYTSASGQPVPPPRGSMDKGRGPHLDSWPYPMRNSSISDLDGVGLRPVTPTPKITDESSLPLDPMLTRELVNLFFANCHPQTLFIHRSSFLHDLSRSQVPQYLLLAVLAVATPYSARQAFRTTPSWHAGEQFALEAKRTIFHEGAISLNSPDSLETLHIKPCVELAQALCLLHANDFMTRLSTESARLLVLAQGVLKALDVHTMDNLTQIPAHKNYVRNECMRRTFWYIFHIETLASAFIDRPLPVLPEQTRVLRLPSEETLFDMPRIEVRPNMDPSYDYLSLPLDQKVCQSEFANLIRVGFIYSGVIAAIGQKARVLRAWEQGRVPISQAPSVNKHETELRTWLELLPDHLRLTEDNLQAYLAQLDGGAGSSAWCFLYMHALAESTVLALHEFADLGSEINSAASLATRQQKALDNLIMILNSMGHRGRTKPIMAILLVTLARHTTPSQQPQVATWFSEYLHMWGVSYEEMMNLQFRVSWYLGRSEPIGTRLFDDLDQQSLYQISGRGSSASTQSLSASEPSSGAVISPGTFGGSAMGLTGITLHPSNCSLFNEESTNLLFKRLVDGSVDNIGPSTTSIEGQPATSMIGVARHRMPPENYGGIALDPSYLPRLDLSSALGHSAGPDFIGDRTARDDLPHLFPHGPAGRPRFLSISSHGYGSFGSAESEGGDSQPASASPQVFSMSSIDHRQRQVFDAISLELSNSIPRLGSAKSSPVVALSSTCDQRMSPPLSISPFSGHVDDDDFMRGPDLCW